MRILCVVNNMFRRTLTTVATSVAKYEEAVNKLNSLQAPLDVQEQLHKDWHKLAPLNVPRMLQFAARVGIHEDDLNGLNVIHVSGTKGKGSTCAYCESVLRHHGYKTGFLSSPHLIEVRERVAVNGSPISHETFVSYFWEIFNSLDKSKDDHEGLMPNFYGFITLMSLYIFLREGVDVAVLEVGKGGEYDVTNVIKKPVVCGVSSLGLDHTYYLGSTIDKIAWHKAGIFRPAVPAFTVPQPPEAMNVLIRRAEEIGCPLSVCPELTTCGSDVKLGIKGSYQKLNAALAVQLCNTWIHRRNESKDLTRPDLDGVLPYKHTIQTANSVSLTPTYRLGLEQCRWQGRNQTIKESGITFYLDGAHTQESMQQCVEWFITESSEERSKSKNGVYRVLIVFIALERNAEDLLKPLLCCDFDAVLFCTNMLYTHKEVPDHGICTVTKDFLLNKCLEEKAIWENLCNDHIRGGSKYRNYSSVVNVITPFSPGNQGSETIQRNMALHTFPSIEDAIEWVYKRQRVSVQRRAYVLDDCISGSNKIAGACAVQAEGVSGITDGVGAYVVQTCGAGIAGMQVQDAAARFIFDSREVDGYIQKAGGSRMQDENKLGNAKCITNEEKVRVSGEQSGIPHVQVLVTGSLNLVGGAIQILHERNGYTS